MATGILDQAVRRIQANASARTDGTVLSCVTADLAGRTVGGVGAGCASGANRIASVGG
jgi:hypothetical protein